VNPPVAEDPVIHARFDPSAGALPKPTDILRDADAMHLDIPAEPEDLADKTPAEAALIRALNRRDGWPRTIKAEVEFTGALDPASITESSIRIFEVTDGIPSPIELAIAGEPELAPTKILISPPEGGWLRAHTYVAIALGGTSGLVGAEGEPVVADAAFYFLRSRQSLLDHVRAIPGADDAEKQESAEKLEEIRLELAPWFAHAEKLGLVREQIVALWSFTASEAIEVVMDKDAGKMPIPSDFLRDPATGLVDIPVLDDDTELEVNAKKDLAKLDGFGLSADLLFDLSGPFDPNTLPGSVRLYAMPENGPPVEIALGNQSRRADTAVLAQLPEHPLAPATDHLVVITTDLKDTSGRPVAPMLPGMLALLDQPIYDGTQSLIGSVDNESAARVEPVRAANARGLQKVIDAGLLSSLDQVAVAWPFHTMSVYEPMRAARDAAELLDLPSDPVDVERRSPFDAALDFPLSALTLLRVGDVYEGSIVTADFLDPLTRKNREDGRWEPRKIHFVMTVPANHDPDEPLRTVIFGHGLMTERRFVLAIGDALAAEGLAAISIDFPYHGERTHCVLSGPQCLVNPLDQAGPMICPAPCENGTTCAPDGRCVDNAGEGNALNNWPIVGFPQASGGAFVDVDNMVGTRDHFYQAITDLSALQRSLLQGDWKTAIGTEIDPEIGYMGQSLGGIIGSVFMSVHPEITNAVLNVPGADLLDMFRESVIFKPHFDAFLLRENIEPGSAKHEQILNIARWIMDPIDPHSFSDFLLDRSFEPARAISGRKLLIQMATLDLIIGNPQTELLGRLSGILREDYLAEHGFIVIPVEPAYPRGTREAAAVLSRGEMP
jgi:hypothetical protein